MRVVKLSLKASKGHLIAFGHLLFQNPKSVMWSATKLMLILLPTAARRSSVHLTRL
jgi:hypothetical protein